MSHVLYRRFDQHYPTAVAGSGIKIRDQHGKSYIDACAGAAVSCLGHSHPRVIEAVCRQIETLPYAHTGFFTNEPAEALADHLIAAAPAGLDKVFYTSGGSEAVEAALKMARQYFV
ncbi:MAG: aminotransferase class III-fold pyridoxal phosphate-dependent enzyme, partial [Pseudomonadota bacterium]